MSEEEKKETPKARIVSIIALIVSILTFMCGLLILILAGWAASTDIGGGPGGIDALWVLLFAGAVCSMVLIAPIGLVLSILTLFIERNIYLRAAPLSYVLCGILMSVTCLFDFN
jgi:hypothetical protein